MAIWGKLIGGGLGFLLGGPLGAILGAAFGHNFDNALPQLGHQSEPGLSPGETERVQMVFFTASFSVMGHLAKSDGKVSKSEIAMAEQVMDSMGLTSELRAAAIKLFNEGKNPDFDLEPTVIQFREECARRTTLYRMFLEILIQAAMADGKMDHAEEAVLLRTSELLGFPEFAYRQIEAMTLAGMGYQRTAGDSGNQGGGARGRSGRAGDSRVRSSNQLSLADARKILGVDKDSDKAVVKRAYRRLMSQHHPDKLVAKGLPEEMMKLATEKTQQIQQAYETVKESQGWK